MAITEEQHLRFQRARIRAKNRKEDRETYRKHREMFAEQYRIVDGHVYGDYVLIKGLGNKYEGQIVKYIGSAKHDKWTDWQQTGFVCETLNDPPIRFLVPFRTMIHAVDEQEIVKWRLRNG